MFKKIGIRLSIAFIFLIKERKLTFPIYLVVKLNSLRIADFSIGLLPSSHFHIFFSSVVDAHELQELIV